MTRDNFTEKTKRNLGEAVGFCCVRPGCGKVTHAFNRETSSMYGIGNAAHDSGAARNGPRYIETLTKEQRKSLENGAHLCPTCARLVDIDPERFPYGTISNWQLLAEKHRQSGLTSPNQPYGIDFRDACIASKKFLELCSFEIQVNPYYISKNIIDIIEGFLCRCQNFHSTNEMCALFPHLVNIQIQMIDSLRRIIKEIKSSGMWINHNGDYHLARESVFRVGEVNAVTKSREIVNETLRDFFNQRVKLSEIVYSHYPKVDLYSW
ncbi:hypothetical protein AEST_22100 [Alishewanella aestuarii B11]|uniref:HNH endonuclease n=1 Tax=Alishewanella aestuarii B11 TaxID=1197174 RepID=J1Q207_9ALTE|nr:hypothetical protein [Alishewanella aestuarii]EJI85108.1 hypothetical protein AEST_22100 [Alishewanella aestuarii B11]